MIMKRIMRVEIIGLKHLKILKEFHSDLLEKLKDPQDIIMRCSESEKIIYNL
jgi:hypothetical protein